MCFPVFIKYLNVLNFGKLLEISHQKIGDGVGLPRPIAGALEVDVHHPVSDFVSVVAGEAVVESDPAIGIALGRTWTIEVFIQNRAKDVVRA